MEIKRQMQQAPIVQNPRDFELIRALDEPIPELKIIHGAWTYVVEPTCRFTALAE